MEDLRTLAERLAREAGALLLDRLDGVRTVESKSTPTDVVSEVDRASEALIVATLRRERPADGIVGEEGTDDPGTSGLRWVVDPLDGTVNYLYRAPGFAVSVGVEDDEGPLAGAVYDPLRDELFSAARGAGATLNGAPLRASGVTDLAHTLVATGFSYDAATRGWQAQVLTKLLPRVRDIRRGGSAALELCGVAAGRVDAYYELGPAPWDRLAGLTICAEAGARWSIARAGWPDSELTYVVAPGVAPAFGDLLAETGAIQEA